MLLYIIIIIIILLFYLLYLFYYDNLVSKKKIAFLFLIYDEINHEDLWKLFFKSVDKNKYNIYIHYKDYKKSEYFDKYKLNKNILTKWGDISLVNAHNLLLEEALVDSDNTHFILISNSCIPLKKFDYIYNKLDNNFSYFNLLSNNDNYRCHNALKYINKNDIKKAHQWSILNKKHALLLTKDKNKYIDWFDICPDEHSHITYLFYNKLDKEIIKTIDAKYEATTFTNWIDNILTNYSSIDSNEIIKLYNSPCFFGRKFIKNCTNLNELLLLLE